MARSGIGVGPFFSADYECGRNGHYFVQTIFEGFEVRVSADLFECMRPPKGIPQGLKPGRLLLFFWHG
jgi:hypothetical protein